MTGDREPKRTGNVNAGGWPDDEYSADLGRGSETADLGDTTVVTRTLAHHEAREARDRLGDAIERVTVLVPGTRLRQGSTYLDLERLEDGPFVARAGQEVDEHELIVSKKELDYEAWNALVGEAQPR